MTKIVLTNDLKKTALEQYHPYINIDLWSLEQSEYDNGTEKAIILNNTVNMKILNKDIEKLLATDDAGGSGTSLQEYQKFVSKPQPTDDDEFVNTGDFTNVIFTPFDNESNCPINNIIIPYEYYKGVFYLELPRFYRTISLHILNSYYDASDDVVLFHTEDILDYIKNNPEAWITNNNIRDNDKINNLGGGIGRYLISLPQYLRHMPSIEIDVFYKYLNEYMGPNQIGIIDTSVRGYTGQNSIDKEYEDQQTLIKTNFGPDKVTTLARRIDADIKNNDSAIQYHCLDDYFTTNSPLAEINCESTIKYINDNIYIEEYNQREEESNSINRINELNNGTNYIFKEWADIDISIPTPIPKEPLI